MHAKAIDKLRRHILGALKQCAITQTWPVYESYKDHVDGIANESLKHKKKWITTSDVYSIFIDHVYHAIVKMKPEAGQLDGPLAELLGENGVDALADRLLAYFEGLPRIYTVYFPVPSLPLIQGTLHITGAMRIEKVTSRNEFPGKTRPGGLLASAIDNIDPPAYYLVFETQGYCGRNFATSAARHALSSFKITMQQALARNIFGRKGKTPIGLGFLSAYAAYNVPKHYMVAVDKVATPIGAENLELPLEICSFLETHEFVDRTNPFALASPQNEAEKLLVSNLRPAAQLHTTAKDGAARIRMASEWVFGSYLNENPTLAFLQTCIALEALFGEDGDGESVTKTLADRCAYLVASDITERKEIRENFRALYSVRSKIVHGEAGTLAAEDEKFLDWGRVILEVAIFREIKHLALEKA